ncbi:MAG: calcium/sodium antiporter [Gammaproteobacteria bacterium]|nr:calcium/sodium antiporter [Gammaproteobacteria bacterium]
MPQALLLVLAGAGLLFAGGEALVRGGSGIGLRYGLSPLVVGLTIVAFGTSSPELAVSIKAALGGLDDVAIGNVVGSNIFNIAGILGFCCLLQPLRVESQIVRLDMPVALAATVLVVLLLGDGALSRGDGGVLGALLAAYVGMQLLLSRRRRDALAVEFEHELRAPGRTLAADIGLVVAGLALLVGGASLFVDGAVAIARLVGVSEAVIALTVVAIGTSLPELATSLIAAFRKEADIAIGNVIGSNIFNLLGILGVSSVITPLSRGNITTVDLWVMLAVTAALWPVLYTGLRLSRIEGTVLFCAWLGYTAWLLANV